MTKEQEIEQLSEVLWEDFISNDKFNNSTEHLIATKPSVISIIFKML